ncbi:MAG: glutamine synthetase III [Candidatus Competibacteraceae bacterium]|nr:glutamine synthetase III [Candidatus Competibacteraceae bacterium]
MLKLRAEALYEATHREYRLYEKQGQQISTFYAENVFGDAEMRSDLSTEVYERLINCIVRGEKIDHDTADAVATALKSWAMARGVTHYTHWFHPLRGATAEKHDSFFELRDGSPIERFKGSALVQQEPDASSFPHGGIRSTFEARGYTAWDPSSPAFIYEIANAKTLCIPTVFVAYTGEALDNKAPLLKAIHAIDKAATAVCQYFDKDVQKVTVSLGAEQEYFLVDKALFMARPDLIMCGRTLFGHSPSRGQQLSDHYFGSIPRRVTNFMVEFETEALRLGIPVRTRHNEVAPGQFEVAPQFEELNLATDHNVLLMDIMERVADKHNFRVIFHEKPFKGINGSGKHNNWSLITQDGRNLLAPTSKAKENLQFLTFLVCTVKAVHDYADLLRASIASANNDLRLGGHEAPPAIISVFLGNQLSSVLEELEKNANVKVGKGDNAYLKLGISKIPEIILDNTDRNRTSPFAFTGNKFEFRAVGSTANPSVPMTVLNTAVADVLCQFKMQVDKELEKEEKKEVAIINVLRRFIKQSKNILFERDNYSNNWVDEAKKRGLNNFKTTPEALAAYRTKMSKALFERHQVFTPIELEARTHLLLDEYIMKVQIESRVIGDLALNHIIPTAIKYQNKLIENFNGLKQMKLDTKYVQGLITDISQHIGLIHQMVTDMTEERKRANGLDSEINRADAYCHQVRPFFEKIRYHVDKLELLVDDADWPLPKYRELLFLR